jgi:hypothetical protein
MSITIDPVAGEQRLIKHNKEHPPKQLKNLKGEELKAHNQRMGTFWNECKKNRGFQTKIMADPNELICAIDEYVSSVESIGLFPTFNGLSLFCDINSDTLYAMENLGDARSAILKKYRQYISEFLNQSGLTSSTNPIFSIFYAKSVLGQSDQVPMTLNVNIGQQNAIQPAEIQDVIQLTPDDWKQGE